MIVRAEWLQVKTFAVNRGLSIQYVDYNGNYFLSVYDGEFGVETILSKEIPSNPDLVDFETNFKPSGNKKLDTRDSDGSILNRVKITTTGWSYQLHGLEFQTSQLNSIESKKDDGTDFGFTIIKCYDINNVQLITQLDCDTKSVKTVIDWEPTHDYEILGGIFRQQTIPIGNLRLWVIGAPDVPISYGGNKQFVTNVNLKFIGLDGGLVVDGKAPKYLTYSSIYHSSKIRIILKHDAGLKHNINMNFEVFKP